jgi:GNAT superfamily N-acetyltransferase
MRTRVSAWSLKQRRELLDSWSPSVVRTGGPNIAPFVVGVLRQAWGRGIGTALLDRFEAWAREHGIWRLELSVMAHNQRAIELYERLGYVSEGIKRSAILVDEQKVDEIIMVKMLM